MDQQKTGLFIAELRKEAGMTQAELGEKIGVTNKTISRWENGNYMPDISVMQTLCQEFNININELLSGKRLIEEDFRKSADENLISSLQELKEIRKQIKRTDFFTGTGTGILFSALFSPDGWRRGVIICLGVGLILVGWYLKDRVDKKVINKYQKEERE